MPEFIQESARLSYEIHGLANQFYSSRQVDYVLSAVWRNSPIDPVALLSPHFQVAMDQRNAGQSSGPILPDHDWDTYTNDQLALMSYLGHEQFAVVGMCIGGPYILNLLRLAPQRVRPWSCKPSVVTTITRNFWTCLTAGLRRCRSLTRQVFPRIC